VNLTAGVYNVFDKQVDNADYGTTLDGRRFNVGFQYTF
jgi:outer membrane receptor for ferrienterochelin and colicins